MVQKTKIIAGTTMFVCPECLKAKSVDVSKQANISGLIKVNCKCPCGHTYTVELDKRRHDREVISLPGVFSRYMGGKLKSSEPMLVLDLSISGLKFMNKTEFNIKKGDELMVKFRLKDEKKSLIKEKVIVRHIEKNEVGAEFCSVLTIKGI